MPASMYNVYEMPAATDVDMPAATDDVHEMPAAVDNVSEMPHGRRVRDALRPQDAAVTRRAAVIFKLSRGEELR